MKKIFVATFLLVFSLAVFHAPARAESDESFRVTFHYPIGAFGQYGKNAGAYCIEALDGKGNVTATILTARNDLKTTTQPADGPIHANAYKERGDDITISVFGVPPGAAQRVRLMAFYTTYYPKDAPDILYKMEAEVEIFPLGSEAVSLLRVPSDMKTAPIATQAPRLAEAAPSGAARVKPYNPGMFDTEYNIAPATVLRSRDWTALPIPDGTAEWNGSAIVLQAAYEAAHDTAFPMQLFWRQTDGPPLNELRCAVARCEIPSPRPGFYSFKLTEVNGNGAKSRTFGVNVPGAPPEPKEKTRKERLMKKVAFRAESFAALEPRRKLIGALSNPYIFMLAADAPGWLDDRRGLKALYDLEGFGIIAAPKILVNGDLLYALGVEPAYVPHDAARPETFGAYRLLVFDIGDDLNPVLAGRLDFGSAPSDFTVEGDYLYATFLNGDAGARVYNVSDPSRIFEVSSFETPPVERGVEAAGRTVYVNAGGGGRVYDLSRFTAPRLARSVAGEFRAIYSAGDKKYALVSPPGGKGGKQPVFELLDLAAPESAKAVGAYVSPLGEAAPGATRVKVIGSVALASRDAGRGSVLEAVNISDPSKPALLWSYSSDKKIGDFTPLEDSILVSVEGGLVVLE